MTAAIQGNLVSRIWRDDRDDAIRDAALVIVGTVLVVAAAKISVPFYPVPLTLQTLAIALVAAAYGFRLGTLTVLAYLGEGLVGLPVFANTPPAVAGPAYFLGTTGGFLAGFVALAAIVGLFADRGAGRSIPRLFVAVVLGDVVMFALGIAWLGWFARLATGGTGIGLAKAWSAGVVPFLLGDLLKSVLVALAVPAAWRVDGR